MKIDLLSAIIVLEHYHALYYRIRLILYYLKKKSNISLFFFLILHRETFHDFKSLFVEFTFYIQRRRYFVGEWTLNGKKKKLDSTNTRPASHLPILSMIMCIKYLRNQNITYIYNKYVIREEFSFSISFALSPNSQKGKKRRKKKRKKNMNKNDRVVLCTAWFVAKCIHLCVAVAAT